MTVCPLCHDSSDFSYIGKKNGYTIVSCGECKFIFVDPMPSEAQLSEIYENYTKDERHLRNARRKASRFWRRLYFPTWRSRGGDFLDVGCNVGYAVEAARRLGFRACGIDVNADAIEKASALFPDCSFQNTNLNDLARTGIKYDFICCSEVIEHLQDVHKFTESLSILLNSRGLLYITTPDAGHFRVRNRLLDSHLVAPPEHLCYFTKDTLQRLLGEHGIRVRRVYKKLKPSLRVLSQRV